MPTAADLGSDRGELPSMTPRPIPTFVLLLLSVVLLLTGCGPGGTPSAELGGSSPPASEARSQRQRLVDVFTPDMVGGSAPSESTAPRVEWRFEQSTAPTDTLGWEVIEGATELGNREGRLGGRTTNALPILRALCDDTGGGAVASELLESVHVRMRATAGANLQLHFVGPNPGYLDGLEIRRIMWNASTPLLADGEFHSYSITPQFPVENGVREVFLRPGDASGAEFEIESIRLVFRDEHFDEAPTGVGWHDFDGEFRETIAGRAPEVIRWPLTLPAEPRLEVAVGTLDEQPLTFRVSVAATDTATAGAAEVLGQRTITTPGRWNELSFDLDAYAGRAVTLELALASPGGLKESSGVGLWGTPSVHRRLDPTARGDTPQGVIVILADTLRLDRLGFYGHTRETAPQLSRLVGEGALFLDAHSHAPWTRVSVPALVTSLYPLSHGVRDPLARLPSSAVTLAEVYREAGWATLGFSSIPHTGRFTNMHQGYESFHEARDSIGSSKTARAFVDRLLPWLEDHREERFFVFLQVFDPHFPYEPRPPYDVLWNDPALRDTHQERFAELAGVIDNPLAASMGMAERDEFELAGVVPEPYVEYRQDWYDASILAMDTELGRIVEQLEKLGIADRTLIAFTSDHGEEFLDHDDMGHGQSLYGELIEVPLFLWQPGAVPQGVDIHQPVQQVDLMPTLLELSGLPVPESVQGQSLVPLLQAADGASDGTSRWRERPVISERPGHPHPLSPPPQEFTSTSLIFDGWKLIHHGEGRGERAEYELYDHRDDRGDTRDLAAERPEVVQRLAQMLAEWRTEAEKRQLVGDAELVESLEPEELERLRSLGYIQ